MANSFLETVRANAARDLAQIDQEREAVVKTLAELDKARQHLLALAGAADAIAHGSGEVSSTSTKWKVENERKQRVREAIRRVLSQEPDGLTEHELERRVLETLQGEPISRRVITRNIEFMDAEIIAQDGVYLWVPPADGAGIEGDDRPGAHDAPGPVE